MTDRSMRMKKSRSERRSVRDYILYIYTYRSILFSFFFSIILCFSFYFIQSWSPSAILALTVGIWYFTATVTLNFLPPNLHLQLFNFNRFTADADYISTFLLFQSVLYDVKDVRIKIVLFDCTIDEYFLIVKRTFFFQNSS